MRHSSSVTVTEVTSSASVPQGDPSSSLEMSTSGTLAADPPPHDAQATTTSQTDAEGSNPVDEGLSFTEEVATDVIGAGPPSVSPEGVGEVAVSLPEEAPGPEEVVAKVSPLDEESVATSSSEIEVISAGTSVYDEAAFTFA